MEEIYTKEKIKNDCSGQQGNRPVSFPFYHNNHIKYCINTINLKIKTILPHSLASIAKTFLELYATFFYHNKILF
ncbi:hypothetical protein GCM10028808_62830 [Spirosoma migulaei]